jgi:hypothetical protein
MALIVSSASGNFNAGATWVGGVVPGVGDEAQAANGHTITITADATCDEISNAGTGIFTLADGVTLTANVTNKSTTGSRNCLQFISNFPATGHIVGDCTVESGGGNAVNNQSSGTLNVTGNCIAGVGAFGSSQVSGARNSSDGVLNITGNCFGNSGSLGSGAFNASTGVLNVTGNCTGGLTSTAFGAANTSTGTMLVVGTIEASEFNGGVGGANRGQVTLLTGPFLTSPTFGVNPIGAIAWRWASTLNTSTYIEVPTSDLLAKRNLVTADNVTGMPDEADVKDGVVYGPASELTGTFEQSVAPSVSDIATAVWGAATRTITGGVVDTLTNAPASVTPSDIWSHTTRTITGGTVDTLTNAPTVPSASAIADEVRVELATELARIDAPISGAGNAPSASTVATAVRTELTTELGRIDAAVSSRAVAGDIPASDITAIKAKTDALNTERLANVATTAIVGNLIAQANS